MSARHPELTARLRELIDEYGYDLVEDELMELADEQNERSIATQDNGREWPQVDP